MSMAAPSQRAPSAKRSAPSVGEVDSIMSDATAEMSLAEPGGKMAGTTKRFDHRMSPAHARLHGLAAEMPRPSTASLESDRKSAARDVQVQLNRSAKGAQFYLNGGYDDSASSQTKDSDSTKFTMGGMVSAPQQELNWQSAIATMQHRASIGDMKIHALPRKAPIGGKWSKEEDEKLKRIVEENGPKNWKRVADLLGTTRTDVQCLHRWNKVLKPGLLKGPWTAEEDEVVTKMVLEHGVGNIKWSVIAGELPGRIGKQCRERWFNHLDPSIKRGEWTTEEDKILFEAQRVCGNRWCEIAKLLPGRTENAVKNRFNSSARKRWLKDNGLEDGSSDDFMHDANRNEIARLVRELMTVNEIHHGVIEDGKESIQNDMKNPLDKLLRLVQGPQLRMKGAPAVTPPGHILLSGISGDDRDGSPRSTLQDLPASFRPPSLSLGSNDSQGDHEFAKQVDPSIMTPTSVFLRGYEEEKLRPASSLLGAEFLASSQKLGATYGSDTAVPGLSELVPKIEWAKPSPRGKMSSSMDIPSGKGAQQDFEIASQAWAVAKAVRHVKDVYYSQSREARSSMSVPLEMVPYFGFLNEAGKRSIMRQLVAKFRHDYHSMGGNVSAVPGFASNDNHSRREYCGNIEPNMQSHHGFLGPKNPTPLHAAAASIEPVNVNGAHELNDLFEGDNFPMNEQELKHLWTLSPRFGGSTLDENGEDTALLTANSSAGAIMSPRRNTVQEPTRSVPTKFSLNGGALAIGSPFNRLQKGQQQTLLSALPSAASAAAAEAAHYMRGGTTGSESASQASIASITSDEMGALVGPDVGFGIAPGGDSFNFELKEEELPTSFPSDMW